MRCTIATLSLITLAAAVRGVARGTTYIIASIDGRVDTVRVQVR